MIASQHVCRESPVGTHCAFLLAVDQDLRSWDCSLNRKASVRRCGGFAFQPHIDFVLAIATDQRSRTSGHVARPLRTDLVFDRGQRNAQSAPTSVVLFHAVDVDTDTLIAGFYDEASVWLTRFRDQMVGGYGQGRQSGVTESEFLTSIDVDVQLFALEALLREFDLVRARLQRDADGSIRAHGVSCLFDSDNRAGGGIPNHKRAVSAQEGRQHGNDDHHHKGRGGGHPDLRSPHFGHKFRWGLLNFLRLHRGCLLFLRLTLLPLALLFFGSSLTFFFSFSQLLQALFLGFFPLFLFRLTCGFFSLFPYLLQA